MFKIKIISAAAALFLAQSALAWAPVERGQNEINLFGGVSVSDTSKDINGKDTDIGGSGYNIGFTALTYVADYVAAGIDLTYSNNGYGDNILAGGVNYAYRSEHLAPMFIVKLQPFPRSPVRLYVPLGVGVDIMRLSLRSSDQTESLSDSSVGIALMAGLGLEVELSNNTFAGVEARYMYSDFFGRGSYDVSTTKVTNILFKVGLRFGSDDFLSW